MKGMAWKDLAPISFFLDEKSTVRINYWYSTNTPYLDIP